VRKIPPAPHFDLPRLGSIPALLATPSTPGAHMKNKNKKSLRETLFGFRDQRNAAAAIAKPAPADHEAGTTLQKRRLPRIIGVTEERLRARNQSSWMMSAKAWKEFMHGFRSPAKG
jgi:hypothetical protein